MTLRPWSIAFATCTALLSLPATAQTTYSVADNIPYQDTTKVADRIAEECTELGSNFSQAIAKHAQEQGVNIVLSTPDAPVAPDRLDVVITDVRSYGNAFTGHYKSANIQVTRYLNGVESGQTALERRSMGGITGGFKSSCAVLDRTTNTLASDIMKWVKTQETQTAPAASAVVEAAQ
ncbi:MAG: hypothetical protein Q4G42_06555 [Neisseria sp.]|nr:hypothetical protein [Neisseria sp.]